MSQAFLPSTKTKKNKQKNKLKGSNHLKMHNLGLLIDHFLFFLNVLHAIINLNCK